MEEKKKLEEQKNEETDNAEKTKEQGTEQVEENKNEIMSDQQKTQNENQQKEIISNLEKELVEWTEEPVKLEEFKKESQKIILCLDTLGQDRKFSEDEKNYIDKVANTILTGIESKVFQL